MLVPYLMCNKMQQHLSLLFLLVTLALSPVCFGGGHLNDMVAIATVSDTYRDLSVKVILGNPSRDVFARVAFQTDETLFGPYSFFSLTALSECPELSQTCHLYYNPLAEESGEEKVAKDVAILDGKYNRLITMFRTNVSAAATLHRAADSAIVPSAVKDAYIDFSLGSLIWKIYGNASIQSTRVVYSKDITHSHVSYQVNCVPWNSTVESVYQDYSIRDTCYLRNVVIYADTLYVGEQESMFGLLVQDPTIIYTNSVTNVSAEVRPNNPESVVRISTSSTVGIIDIETTCVILPNYVKAFMQTSRVPISRIFVTFAGQSQSGYTVAMYLNRICYEFALNDDFDGIVLGASYMLSRTAFFMQPSGPSYTIEASRVVVNLPVVNIIVSIVLFLMCIRWASVRSTSFFRKVSSETPSVSTLGDAAKKGRRLWLSMSENYVEYDMFVIFLGAISYLLFATGEDPLGTSSYTFISSSIYFWIEIACFFITMLASNRKIAPWATILEKDPLGNQIVWMDSLYYFPRNTLHVIVLWNSILFCLSEEILSKSPPFTVGLASLALVYVYFFCVMANLLYICLHSRRAVNPLWLGYLLILFLTMAWWIYFSVTYAADLLFLRMSDDKGTGMARVAIEVVVYVLLLYIAGQVVYRRVGIVDVESSIKED
jgi:hypothetical protein